MTFKEIMDKLTEIRNKLLRDAKQAKSEDYKNGYVDGVLDMYNESKPIILDEKG